MAWRKLKGVLSHFKEKFYILKKEEKKIQDSKRSTLIIMYVFTYNITY